MTSRIQNWKKLTNSGNSIVASFDSDVTAGNFLIVAISADVDTSIDSIQTDNGDVFVEAFEVAVNRRIMIAYVPEAVGGATEVTITLTGSTVEAQAGIAEYEGGLVHYQIGTASGNSGSPAHGSIDATDAELVIGLIGTDGTINFAVHPVGFVLGGSGTILVNEEIDPGDGSFEFGQAQIVPSLPWDAGIVTFVEETSSSSSSSSSSVSSSSVSGSSSSSSDGVLDDPRSALVEIPI